MSLRLSVASRVLKQLGDELISDNSQAILEIIKNAYDADSSKCTVSIDPEWSPNSERYREHKGCISINDNGDGLTRNQIENNWLRISYSGKDQQKQEGKTTLKGRLPLGDKGLGRLGAMKVAHIIELTTKSRKDDTAHRIIWDWDECLGASSIENAPIHEEYVNSESIEYGTTLRLIGLRDLDYWNIDNPDLQASLSGMLSIFPTSARSSPTSKTSSKKPPFKIKLYISGRNVPIKPLSLEELNNADLHFDLYYWKEGVDHSITISAKVDKRYFQNANQEGYSKFYDSDCGQTFMRFLKERLPGIRYTKDGSIEVDRVKSWTQWGELTAKNMGAKQNKENIKPETTPGTFFGEIYSFSLKHGRSVTGEGSKVESILKNSSGIMLYRDGFRIRDGRDDWIGLGAEWTSGKSWYGLRPKNTLGYINLSVKDNPDLKEKSDRQGFIENSSSKTFVIITRQIVKQIGDLLNTIRRSFNDFCKEQELMNMEPNGPESIADQLRSYFQELSDAERRSTRIQTNLGAAGESLSDIAKGIDALPGDKESKQTAYDSQARAAKNLDGLAYEISLVKKSLNSAPSEIPNYIEQRLNDLQERAHELNELVGLGLAAYGLAHEISPLARQIRHEADQIIKDANSDNTSPQKLRVSASLIKDSIDTLDGHIGLLGPLLRNRRTQKRKIDFSDYCGKYFQRRRAILGDTAPDYNISIIDALTPLVIKFNEGRLYEVIDNIFRNSEFWLTATKTKEPQIYVEIMTGLVYIFDNGPGINPEYETTLFDLFVSDTPNGHGVGLFLVSEIMHAYGCTISLGAERNSNGRRYKFILNFEKVAV